MMTRATCPHCQNADCPPVSEHEYLCPSCGKAFRPGYVTLDEAMERLGVTRDSIKSYLLRGKLDGLKEMVCKGCVHRMCWTWITEESVNRLRGNHCPRCGFESEGGELCEFCREEQASGKRRWYERNLSPASSWRAGSLGVYR